MIKMVKVPVAIEDEDKKNRNEKYRIVRAMLKEAQTLGNKAIRILAGLDSGVFSTDLAEDGKPTPVDTFVYRKVKEGRKLLSSQSMASLLRNYVRPMHKAARKKNSIPSIRNPVMPVISRGTKILQKENQFEIIPPGLNKLTEAGFISFVSRFSHKDKGSISIVKNLMESKYKLKDSLLVEKDRLLFFLLAYEPPKIVTAPEKEKKCVAVLTREIPITCTTGQNKPRKFIGNSSDILAAKAGFRQRRFREMKRQGLKTRSVNWVVTAKEKKWTDAICHQLARQLINFCLGEKCGTLVLNQEGKCSVPASSLVPKIMDKAKQNGITVIENTAKWPKKNTCPNCGNEEGLEKHKRSNYKCTKCGHWFNSDEVFAKKIYESKQENEKNEKNDADELEQTPNGDIV